MVELVHTSRGSSYATAHVLHCPPPPPWHSGFIGPAVINNNSRTLEPGGAGEQEEEDLFVFNDRECVLFIGTQFSNLYTAVDTPAKGRLGVCVVFVFACKYVLGHSRVSQPPNSDYRGTQGASLKPDESEGNS